MSGPLSERDSVLTDGCIKYNALISIMYIQPRFIMLPGLLTVMSPLSAYVITGMSEDKVTPSLEDARIE